MQTQRDGRAVHWFAFVVFALVWPAVLDLAHAEFGVGIRQVAAAAASIAGITDDGTDVTEIVMADDSSIAFTGGFGLFWDNDTKRIHNCATTDCSSADGNNFWDTDADIIKQGVFDTVTQVQTPQVRFSEKADPGAAPPNFVYLYVDSTSNDLMARFDSGAAVTVAAHP